MIRPLLSVVVLAACVVPAPEPEEPTSATTAEVGGGRGNGDECSPAICGANSPVVKLYRFHHVRLDGAANDGGFKLLGLTKEVNGAPRGFRLGAADTRLFGVDATGAVALSGQDLAGATMWLADARGEQYGIVFESVGQVDTVINRKSIETYRLVWSPLERGSKPLPGPIVPSPENIKVPALAPERVYVCNKDLAGRPRDDREKAWDETYDMAYEDTVIFQGDMIDTHTLSVGSQLDNDQFNFGCGRSALAKLLLTESTMRFSSGNWQRATATLKMLTANYCDDHTFTVGGQPLLWRQHGGAGMQFLTTPSGLEGRWDENGLLCLDTPRLRNSTFPPAKIEFPDIDLAIQRLCGRRIRSCGNPDPMKQEFASELVTSGTFL
jgi:hypothetical protein